MVHLSINLLYLWTLKTVTIMAKENKEWICSVCGYKYVGPEPPKECPVCHAKKEYFDEAGKEPEPWM